MHTYVLYAAWGWLTFTGVMHFLVDVVSQRVRGVRTVSLETTLYYGLNSSFALGQVVLGALGIWLALRAPELLREAPLLIISVLAGIAWLALTLLFMEYWQPKMNAAIFLALMLTATLLARR